MITELNWSDIDFIFGKYKGCSVQSVAYQNPGYVLWADTYVRGFDVDPNITTFCRMRQTKILKAQKKYNLHPGMGKDIPF